MSQIGSYAGTALVLPIVLQMGFGRIFPLGLRLVRLSGRAAANSQPDFYMLAHG
jgi:hypothetical protein